MTSFSAKSIESEFNRIMLVRNVTRLVVDYIENNKLYYKIAEACASISLANSGLNWRWGKSNSMQSILSLTSLASVF